MIRLLTFIQTNWIAFTLFTLAVITVLSFWPVEQLPSVPGTDKTHHVIAYALLMFPAALRKPKKWTLIGLFFIAYSGLIELAQLSVNRSCECLDVAANTIGVVCGWLIGSLAGTLVRSYSR